MSNTATNPVRSLAATVDARSAAYPSTWQTCPSIRVRMHDGTGFVTARRLKERSSP